MPQSSVVPWILNLARVFGVEVLDELLHADAVAAAQEVPPDDGFRGLGRARQQESGRQRRKQASSDHFVPPLVIARPARPAHRVVGAAQRDAAATILARRWKGAKAMDPFV